MSFDSQQRTLLDAWTTSSSYALDSLMAANRAAFAAFGVTGSTAETETPAGSDAARSAASAADSAGPPDAEATDAAIAGGETRPDWEASVTVDHPDHMSVGDQAIFSKTVSEEDVQRFAIASGDTNPLHLEEAFAERTRFRGRIAHGTLVGGLISAALARLPGLTIYLSQDLEFHNPVRIGDRLEAVCEIVEDLGDDQYRLTTRVYDEDQEEVIIDGEAVVLIDDVPEQAADGDSPADAASSTD